eukprot:5614741-Amphidinium_carterae.1
MTTHRIVKKTKASRVAPTCTFCFNHCMMLTKVDTDVAPPEWLCKGTHPEKVLQASIRGAYAQVQALGVPVGTDKSGDVEDLIPFIGALHPNQLWLSTGLVFNALMPVGSTPEMIEDAIQSFPYMILMDMEYRGKCQAGLDIFLSMVKRLTNGWRCNFSSYAKSNGLPSIESVTVQLTSMPLPGDTIYSWEVGGT